MLDLPRARTGRFASARVRLFVPSSGWGGRRRREMLLAAAGIAVLFHVAMVGAIVEAPGLMPAFLRTPPPKPPPPPPEAELVMVKQDTPTVGGTPPPQKSPPPAPKAAPQQAPSGGGPSSPPLDAPQGPAVPPPADTQAPTPGHAEAGQAKQATPPPAPPASTMQVNLDIDGQPGWGLVDERTIAASPDDHYINKPAAYPRAAALRGEEGTVYLATLVAPDGHAESVQVEQSSGYPELDRAARNAVAAWHFRPAIRDGQAVQSEMLEAYHFHLVR